MKVHAFAWVYENMGDHAERLPRPFTITPETTVEELVRKGFKLGPFHRVNETDTIVIQIELEEGDPSCINKDGEVEFS